MDEAATEARLVILVHAQIAEDVSARLDGLGLSPRTTLLAGPDAPYEEQLEAVSAAYRTYLDHRRTSIVVGSRILVPSETSLEVT